MGWRDSIENKLNDALEDAREAIGERLEQGVGSWLQPGPDAPGGGEIELTVDGLSLEPYALIAQAALSQPGEYRFFCAVGAGLEAGSLLGKSADWRCISADGLSCDYAGQVMAIEQGRTLPDGREEWIFSVTSGLASLSQQSRYRIVHQRSVIELAEALLKEHGLTVDNRTRQSYLVMDWTTQVGETDLQFLQRQLARHGIWCYSRKGDQGEIIVLADDQHGAERADRGQLDVMAEVGGNRSAQGMASVALRQSHRYYRWQPEKTRMHQQVCPSEFPAQTQDRRSGNTESAAEQVFFEAGSPDAHDTISLARLETERQQCRAHVIRVSGAIGDLQPGQWVPIEGEGPCLVTEARLTFSSPRNHQGNTPTGFVWEAELLHLSQAYRPALPAKVSPSLVFPARVESSGPYSELDGQCRRVARLHFDGAGKPHAESSPPLRQLQPYGSLPGLDGLSTGWDWPLRDGAEVLLTCLNNDPDQPVILGYAPAANQPGPVINQNASENRLLTPAGNQLSLDDRKNAQAITLNTPDGECLLALDAASDSPIVTLACEQGALVMRAGGSQSLEVGKSSQTRVGSDSTIQVMNHSSVKTDSGLVHYQSQTDTHATAKNSATLEAKNNLELYSAANSQLRIEGNLSIAAKKGLATRIGGSLHLQAADAIDIRGDGSGDITLHQGGGGITIKTDGTIRLFGNTVTLKSQSGVTFNGNMEYGVPVPVVADSPVPVMALTGESMPELDLDPEWQSDSSSMQLRSVTWLQNRIASGSSPFAKLAARGLTLGDQLTVTVIEKQGESESAIETIQHRIDKASGELILPWTGQLPAGQVQLTDDRDDEVLQARNYWLRVEYQGQQVETEAPLQILGDLQFTPLSEAGGPLPEGAIATVEDANGELHYSKVTNGLLSFKGVPLGDARLSLDHYQHLSEPEYKSNAQQHGDACALRSCSRADNCLSDSNETTNLTCKLAPVEDFIIIPASEEVLLLTEAEVKKLQRLEEKYNAPVKKLQEAIQAGDDRGAAEARKELEVLLSQAGNQTSDAGESGSKPPERYANGGNAPPAMIELVRPLKMGGSQFSFIPSDALAYHSLEGERRYTVPGIRDALTYGTNDLSDKEQAEKRTQGLKDAFGNVSAKINAEVELVEKREGQIRSRQALALLGPGATLLQLLPDSWFQSVDNWVAGVNEKAKFSVGWKQYQRDKALELLASEELDQSGVGEAQDAVSQVWSAEGENQPEWLSEFTQPEDLTQEERHYWHGVIKETDLPPESFEVSGGASFMRYVGGATASADIDLMKGMVSAEAKAEMDLSLAQGKMQGQFMLPDKLGWQASFNVRRRSTQIRVDQVRSLLQTVPVDHGSFPSPHVVSLLNQRLRALRAASQLTRTEMRVDAIGRDASGNYCPYRTRAIQSFLLGDVNGWLALFREGIWGGAEQQQISSALGVKRVTSYQPMGQLLTMMNDELLPSLSVADRSGSGSLQPNEEKELRLLIIQYFQKYRDLAQINTMSFYSSVISSHFHQCPPPNSQSFCDSIRRPSGNGDILLNPFRVTVEKNVLQDEEAKLGNFRFDVTTSLTGYAGANLLAAGKVYINPKEGSLEAIGLRSDAPWPDQESQRSGMINTTALATPSDNVKVAKSTRSPFDTELDDQQGANVKLEAFVGVKATLGIKGGLMWQQPQASQFKALGSVGYSATGMAGIGAGLDFQVGFDRRTGRFVIHCKAELAFKLGVGGGFSFTVDAIHVKDFLVLLYNELSDAEFNIIDLFAKEGDLNTAFDAFCSFQYELFKLGGGGGVAAGAAATGGVMAVSAVQAVFNYRTDLLYRWERWDEDSEAAHRLAETLLDEEEARELLGYAFPETKGRLLNTLISAGTTQRDINLLSGGFDERREEAVVVVLESIQHAREYQEVMEHMGVNIPVNDGPAEKMGRAEDNQKRVMTFLDGEERVRFQSISKRFAPE